jgi:hypothetical protein
MTIRPRSYSLAVVITDVALACPCAAQDGSRLSQRPRSARAAAAGYAPCAGHRDEYGGVR